MAIQDDLRQAVGERQGSAIRFTDIDGIGQKTAQSIKQSGRIRSPSDVSDKTADELAEQAGISENRARKVIKGAGGDPDRRPRSTTGSVSAAGIKMPQGEFVTEVSDQDKAEAKVSTSLNRGIGRSQEAAAADKGKRAPPRPAFSIRSPTGRPSAISRLAPSRSEATRPTTGRRPVSPVARASAKPHSRTKRRRGSNCSTVGSVLRVATNWIRRTQSTALRKKRS
jgi:ribosomal protein S13